MMCCDDKQRRKKLLDILKNDAYFQEKIVLSSGKKSDYYIDARRVTLNSQGVYLSARVIMGMIQHDGIDAIGGPTLGADSLAGAIAALSFQDKNPLNAFIIRKKPKMHGKQQQIEGPLLAEGARVVLIDDVATSGKSLVESLEVLARIKVKVIKAICLVDRNEGAKEALQAAGCPLVSLFEISDFR